MKGDALMDPTAILALKDKDARELFPGDEEAITSAFHGLAKHWHPDHCSAANAKEVFQRIVSLKAIALRLAGVAVDPPKVVEFSGTDGKSFEFRYRTRHAIDVGSVITGDTTLCYVFGKDFTDIFKAEADRIAGLPFADDKMKREMGRFLPIRKRVVEQASDTVLVLGKTEDQFLLADLISHCGGRIEPTHVAWIISGLENIACYLGWAGLSHGAIGPYTVLVSPKFHSVALVGGWGFTTKLGDRPKALPSRTLAALPRMAIPGTAADPAIDLDLIRLTARECLGDASGGRLYGDPSVPAALTNWLMMPPAKDAFADYGAWPQTLEKAFGKRRFVPWDVKSAAVYATA